MKIVPRFIEAKIDNYFPQFELAVKKFSVPETLGPTLLQTVLTVRESFVP